MEYVKLREFRFLLLDSSIVELSYDSCTMLINLSLPYLGRRSPDGRYRRLWLLYSKMEDQG